MNTSRVAAVCRHLNVSIQLLGSFSVAKEDRQLYTLKPRTATETTPTPTSDTTTETTPTPTSDVPVTPVPQPPPAARTCGPVRTQRISSQARARTGPLSVTSNRTRKGKEAPENITYAEAEADLAEPNWLTLTLHSAGNQPPPSQFLDDAPNNFEPFDSSPAMEVDEVPPTIATTFDILCDLTIHVRINPTLGVPALVQTSPPALLSADHDERPNWLLISIKELLQYVPYYSCLNKVVDLWLAQEARLGYPTKVRGLRLLHVFTY